MSKAISGVDHVDGMLPILQLFALWVYSTYWLCTVAQ